MKNLTSKLTMVLALMVSAIFMLSAQTDDLYYNPETDGKPAKGVYYDDQVKDNDDIAQAPTDERRRYKNDRPDNDRGYYDNDDYDEYDDYDYYYSSRIRRFNRPFYGFGYFDDCYVGMFNYDPFWTGTTIYVGFDSYWDYRRWRRWNNFNRWNTWGPTFNWGWGYQPWGWNYGWNTWGSPFSPWGWNAYTPCPPFGNIIVNNVYYGNNWGWNGGFYNGWNGYNGGGYYNEYTSNVYYGPRKSAGSVTDLKGNPRGRFAADFENPRGITNQGPQNANPGRVRDKNDGVISRPGNVQNPDVPARPNRPVPAESVPNKPDRIKDKDVSAPVDKDKPVRPERPEIKRDQKQDKPYIPKDVERPAKKEDQIQKREDQSPKPNRGRKNYPDGQGEDEYMFSSQKPSKSFEGKDYSSDDEGTDVRESRKERNAYQNARPPRQQSSPRPSMESRNFDNKYDSQRSRSNFGGGSSRSYNNNNSSAPSRGNSVGGGERRSSSPRGK